MTIPISSGGGIPIRGQQKFDITTADDYTFQGQRFLRQTVIETDQNLFNTAIWNIKNLLPVSTTPVGLSTSLNAEYTFKDSLGNLYSNFSNSTVVSVDDGFTWANKTAITINKGNFIETDDGKVCFLNTGATTGQLYYTEDQGDTKSGVISTGATGSTPEGLVTDGVKVVVTAAATWRHSTNAALTTWGPCNGTGLIDLQAVDKDVMAYGNGVWVASSYNNAPSRQVSTSPDGITWTVSGTVFGDANHSSGGLIFDQFAGVFRKFGEITGSIYNMWTSPDGVTWTDEGEVVFDGVNIPTSWGRNVFVNDDGILYMNNVVENSTTASSYDGGKTWRPVVVNQGNTAASGYNIVFNNAGQGIVLSTQTAVICDFDLYAGMYYPVEIDGSTVDVSYERNTTFVRIS